MMNAHPAIRDAYAGATRVLLSMAARSENEQLRDMWRGSHSEIEDHLMMIKQHTRTVSVGLGGDYVEGCRQMLAWRLPRYVEAVRRVTEAELEMAARGMAFAQSSDAWEY